MVTGLKEPLRSQVQLKMSNDTKYADVREWILQYESLTTPWGFAVPSKGSPSNQDVPQPMDVDIIKGKGKDKGKKGKDKGKKGKDSKGKSKDGKGRPGDGKGGWNNGGMAAGRWLEQQQRILEKPRKGQRQWSWKGPRRLQPLWPEGPLEVGVPHEGQGQRKGEPGGDATTRELDGIYLNERFYHLAFCLTVPRVDLEKLIWSEEDWPYLAAFVKADEAKGKPKPGGHMDPSS